MSADFQLQLKSISYCHILLDTNVFIDAYDKPTSFSNIFDLLKQNNNVLFTINSVLLEFLKGSRSVEEFNKKKQFIVSIIDNDIFTLTKNVEDLALKLSLALLSSGGNTAPTDLYLGAMLNNFKASGKVLVMSKNHKDFPTTIFERVALINIENEKDIQIFAFYRFDQQHYDALIERIIH